MKPTKPSGQSVLFFRALREAAGWSPGVLEAALVGVSHRSGVGLAKLVEVVALARDPRHPYRWRVRYCRRSDTGRSRSAMWSLLGRARASEHARLGEFWRGLGRRRCATPNSKTSG